MEQSRMSEARLKKWTEADGKRLLPLQSTTSNVRKEAAAVETDGESDMFASTSSSKVSKVKSTETDLNAQIPFFDVSAFSLLSCLFFFPPLFLISSLASHSLQSYDEDSADEELKANLGIAINTLIEAGRSDSEEEEEATENIPVGGGVAGEKIQMRGAKDYRKGAIVIAKVSFYLTLTE
jgi:hypothetical protein